MTSAIAKVTPGHVASAKAAHVPSSEVAAAEATDVASAEVATAEAAHMASAEATHMAATTASVSSATAAGLCISGQKAAGKHCTCQHHQHSSSHHILLWNGRNFPPQGSRETLTGPRKPNVNAVMGGRWGSLSVVSIKFPFIRTEPGSARTKGKRVPDHQLDIKRWELRMLFQPRNLDRELS
jgi:hypothetical protein